MPHGSDMLFDAVQHRHHVLQGGTQLLQVRGAAKVPALVISTGEYYPFPLYSLLTYWKPSAINLIGNTYTVLPKSLLPPGFYTARGELVRSILYPRPHHLYLYWDLLYLLAAFLTVGLGAVIWSGFTWRSVGVCISGK